VAAIAVYVETIPTASGGRAVGPAATRPRALPPSVRGAIAHEGGRDARTLVTLATSPGYGAPGRARNVERPPDVTRRPAPDDRTGILRASVSAVGAGGSSPLLALGVLIASGSAAVLLVGLRRGRTV
jgi:hypothetical protein